MSSIRPSPGLAHPARRAGAVLGLVVVALAVAPFGPAAQAAHRHPLRLAQAADQSTTTTNQTVTPIFPTQTTSSQTCMFGCSSQMSACQSTCIGTPTVTAAGTTLTTVMPSITTAGTATTPTQCQSNCSTQLQTCQRGCSLR